MKPLAFPLLERSSFLMQRGNPLKLRSIPGVMPANERMMKRALSTLVNECEDNQEKYPIYFGEI